MKERILKALRRIERENNVKILWAIESGSRAWGFASEDSDYDVRCMHVASLDDYLGINEPAKQINFSKGKLDIESWDIKKFASLMLKSNPQIAEWLRSPVIYIDSPVRKRLKELFNEGCSLEFLRQHYVRMAKQNYLKYMGPSMAHSCKKYLYVLRGIACSRYIQNEKKLPPLPYKEVIPYLPDEAQEFFEKCVIQKNTTEKATIIAEKAISRFIEETLNENFGKYNQDFLKKDELDALIVGNIKKHPKNLY